MIVVSVLGAHHQQHCCQLKMEHKDEHCFFLGCDALWSGSKTLKVVVLSRDEVESDRRLLTFLG